MFTPVKELATSEFWNVKVTDVVIAGFTVVLAVVTAVLACYTARLWRATKDLVRDSSDTARKELRAYVKMSHDQPGLTFETDSGVFRVWIHVKNYGRTIRRPFAFHKELSGIYNPRPSATEVMLGCGQNPGSVPGGTR